MKELTKLDSKTIHSLFASDKEVLICLFPFHKQVFADHYNVEANLRLTFPLLSKVSWNEISREIGFNSLNRLAKGILELQEPFKTELNEYCKWKKIEYPDYSADRFPESILIPLIQYSRKSGLTELRTKEISRFPDSATKTVLFGNKDEFEIYQEIKKAKALRIGKEIEIILPDYDSPYAILSGPKEKCFEIVKFCEIEYSNPNNQTKFDWWNEEEK